jgi:5-methylcytosine-specific restriction endonuclease McrA
MVDRLRPGERYIQQVKKDSSGCVVCGEKDIRVLHFHHKNPKTKKDGVAMLANKRASIAVLQEEIEKCILLCANCHAKFHAKIPE